MESYTESLRERVENGTLTVIDCFDGEFRWLSNFYMYGDGLSVEHVYQASKPHKDAMWIVPEGDQVKHVTWQERILACKTPGAAKRVGQQAPLRKDWDKLRLEVMYNALVEKFNIRQLGDWLVATGEIPLIEGNYWHDNYWGDCFCRKCKGTRGMNHLGILLMRVRKELRATAYLLSEEEQEATLVKETEEPS